MSRIYVSRALAALLSLAFVFAPLPAVHAGDGDGKPKKRDDFDFGTDGPARPQPGRTPTRPGPRVAPADADPIAAEVARLSRWPARSSQLAAEALFLRGNEAIPYLVRALDDGDFAVQPGAATVLGRIGEPVHIQAILRAAAKRANGHRAEEFFEAAWNLDPKKTKTWLIGFLPISDRPIFRTLSAKFLAARVNSEDRDRVDGLLRSRKPAVRAAGLELLQPAGVEDAEARMTAALSDISPEVSRRAALLLGMDMTPERGRRLNDLARAGEARERAYALLALVDAMRAKQTVNTFERATLVETSGRRGLLHPDKLNRAAAAVGLAYGALDSTDSALTALLDSTVMEVLIDAVGGEHFRDYASFMEPVFTALKRLSGRQDLPDNAIAWARWWREAKSSFRSRRPLRDLSASMLPRAWIEYRAIAGDGRRVKADFSPADGLARPDSFLLSGEAFAALVSALQNAGVFESEAGETPRADEHISISIRVADQRRRLILAPSDTSGHYMRLRMRFQSLIDANIWQRYRDTDRAVDLKSWWRTNSKLMAEAAPDERDMLLASAIVYAYDDLRDEDERRAALDRLQSMESGLTRAQLKDLARNLAGEAAFGALEAEGLAWIVEQADQEVRENVITVLADRREPQAQKVLSDLLERGGLERIREGFSDPRAGMRASAALAARRTIQRESNGNPKLAKASAQFEALEPGLEVLALDDEAHVRIQALVAQAALDQTGIPKQLEEIYKGGNLGVKLEVTEALGDLPGGQGHPWLTFVVSEERTRESARLRAVALQSMARSKHPNAVRLLGYYLMNDADAGVQKAASDSLAELGTPDARFVVLDPLNREQLAAPAKARLLRTLARFDGEIVDVMLRRHLSDADLEVEAEAALGAAERRIPEAVPTLIQLLRRGTPDQRSRGLRAMELLTSKRFDATGYSILAERYEQWYERARGQGFRRWLRDALKERGYDVGSMGSFVDGEADLRAVPTLISAMRDPDPVIRRNAAVSLEDVTGLSVGEVDRGTPPRDVARMADRWSEWWDQKGRALLDSKSSGR
jgi:HEAT repeat protein